MVHRRGECPGARKRMGSPERGGLACDQTAAGVGFRFQCPSLALHQFLFIWKFHRIYKSKLLRISAHPPALAALGPGEEM